MCEQEGVSGGGTRCKSCAGGSGSRNTGDGVGYFLLYGGCYNNDEWPGTDICETVSNRVRTICDTEYGAVFTTSDTTTNERRIYVVIRYPEWKAVRPVCPCLRILRQTMQRAPQIFNVLPA